MTSLEVPKESLVTPRKLRDWCRIYLTFVSYSPKIWQLPHRHHRWKTDNLQGLPPGIDIELQEVVHWLHDSNTSSSSFSGVTKPLADPVNKNWKWLQEKKDGFFQVHDFQRQHHLLPNSFRKKEPWRFHMSKEVSETIEVDALEGTRLSTDLICLDNLYWSTWPMSSW